MTTPSDLYRQALEATDTPILRRTLEPVAADPARFGRMFYQRLFERAPSVRDMFPADLASQELKLAETLLVLSGHLDDLDGVAPVLRGLGQRHHRYGATQMHYDVVGKVLIEVLAEVNGAGFDARARQAWLSLYRWTVQAMGPEVDAA